MCSTLEAVPAILLLLFHTLSYYYCFVCLWLLWCRLGDKVKVQWKLASLKRRDDGLLELTYETPSGKQTLLSRSVLLTTPSYIAADVLQPLSVSPRHAHHGLIQGLLTASPRVGGRGHSPREAMARGGPWLRL